jgi:hypothetical protein
MKLPTDLQRRIRKWFDSIFMAAYNEELDWLTAFGLSDPSYDPDETTKEELRELASEYVEWGELIEGLMKKRDKLECAIIEALLEEKGIVRVKLSDATYGWEQLDRPKRQSNPKKPTRKELIENALASCRKAEAEMFRLARGQLSGKEFGDWILLLMTIHDLASNR